MIDREMRAPDRRAWLASAAGLTLAALGCGDDKTGPPEGGSAKPGDGLARATLELLSGADSLQLFALNPARGAASASPAGTTVFHAFAVLGSASLADAASRERLVALIDRGIRESDGTIAACFNPRHGVSAKRGERTVDLVICYECHQIEVYEGEAKVHALTSRGVEAAVSTIFREAGLTLAP